MTIATLERLGTKPATTSAGLQTSHKPLHATGDRLGMIQIRAAPVPLQRIVAQDQNGLNARISSLAGLAAFAITSMLPHGGTSARWMGIEHHKVDGQKIAPIFSAPQICERLKAVSELTNEQIAPLLGISRRSLQSWLAGAPISNRKEERLRQVYEAIGQIAANYSGSVRDAILHRPSGGLSPYDLLVESRFDEALSLITGKHAVSKRPSERATEPLSIQLGRQEISPPSGPSTLMHDLAVVLGD